MSPKHHLDKKPKFKKRGKGTPEERAARSTNWKLDREMDQKLRACE